MRFLRYLQDTRLSPLRQLDIAYIVVLLPLIGMLKLPMILFSIISIGLIVFKRKPAGNMLLLALFFLGILALYLSLYGAFSFTGLSRLKLFLELLIYILIIVVSMQRLTHTINFYLLISPFLFLALSLFFYHGIVMLGYVVFEVFFLLWMILSHRMAGDLHEGFKASSIMFLYSLPWVVVLFIFFPRISFEHANYGFRGEVTQRMGHDGTMYLDSNALLVPSERIVMEVGFDKEVPADSALYFRGSILYHDKKDHWEGLLPYQKRDFNYHFPNQGKKVDYKVTLYPTQKKWLYMLDMPAREVDESMIDGDFITTVEKKIEEPLHYIASSNLNRRYADTLDKITQNASSYYDPKSNPKSQIIAKQIAQQHPLIQNRAQAINLFFKAQSLTYTLKPDLLDINNSTDSFLFEKRRGYCVHFASSFVNMARMSGIPARIVTGYKAERSESLNNYLVVKEKHAHAWAELYIDGAWVRYETTATASSLDLESQTQAEEKAKKQSPFLRKLNLYLMYSKYQIETWILYYSHFRQLQLLEYAKNNPHFIAGFVLALLLLIVGTFMFISYLKRPTFSNPALGIINPLLEKLNKKGFKRNPDESVHQYLLRFMSQNHKDETLIEIDALYQKIVYGQDDSKASLKELKRLVKSVNHSLL